ncbi:MAG: thiol reductase thioredoxin [Prolixibacteraceae bacterium]|nr:thiol reductase thioredoxin [Prolixibacteraceae bacterium]MBN2773530.1 thiol reductase thioredoxin [Prolixibacteraceae bacterium]
MKKVIYLVALAVISFYSCGSKPGNKTESNGLTAKTEIVADNMAQGGGSVHLTKDMFLKNVWDYNNSPQEWKFKGDKPAIIDFYADWCGPCKIASPILEEISNEYAGKIDVYKIDTEKERELASVFGISGIPAFLYIPVQGKPVMMSGIARTKEETKNMFIENIGKYLFAYPLSYQ